MSLTGTSRKYCC